MPSARTAPPPAVLDPVALGSAAPDPGAPDPGAPDPGAPDPGAPDPGAPDPGAPDPGAPEPGSGAPARGRARARAIGTGDRPRGWRPTALVGASLLLHAAAVPALLVAPWAWPQAWPWLLGAVAGNHLVLGLAMWPRASLLGPTLVRLPLEAAKRRLVALTFDDGPDPAVTPAVLDLLDRHGARASFFLIGARAAAHPALVREIVRRGHTVENHTWSHPALFACLGPLALRRQVARAQRVLGVLAGRPPRFVRAPLGLRSPLLDPAMAGLGLHHASWSARGLDGLHADPARVLRRLLRGLAPGAVVLLHDGGSAMAPDGRPVVLAVLPRLLDEMAARDLRPVSLPEALHPPEAPSHRPA